MPFLKSKSSNMSTRAVHAHKAAMAHQWNLLGTEVVCSDPWGTVFRKTYRQGNGEPDQHRITMQKPQFALIAALDRSQNLLLVRPYRHGTDRNYWALPSGYMERVKLQAPRRCANFSKKPAVLPIAQPSSLRFIPCRPS